MKTALFAAAAMIAMPAFAQTTPSTAPMPQDQSMAAPQQNAPMTPPTTTPDASTTTAAPAGGQNSMAAPMSTGSTMPDPNAPAAGAPVTTNASGQMSMVGDNLPWCRPGQYNACRERENAKGQGVRQTGKMMRKHKAKKSSM